jgi:hypothetical protein
MIELLIAYLMYEGGAGLEWWALYVALFAFKISHIYKQMQKEKEEELVIKKIISMENIKSEHTSNH